MASENDRQLLQSSVVYSCAGLHNTAVSMACTGLQMRISCSRLLACSSALCSMGVGRQLLHSPPSFLLGPQYWIWCFWILATGGLALLAATKAAFRPCARLLLSAAFAVFSSALFCTEGCHIPCQGVVPKCGPQAAEGLA